MTLPCPGGTGIKTCLSRCASIDPPHPYILRSIELFAGKVAPALGWAPEIEAGTRQVA